MALVETFCPYQNCGLVAMNIIAQERNNFTALRLALALLVVLGHSKILSGIEQPGFPFNLADAAVDSFFVVSGYLITGSYERCRGLQAFFIRRIFRLYPMYMFIVLAQTVILLTLLPGGPFSEMWQTMRYIAANALMANFVQYDIGGLLSAMPNPGMNPSLWTLKIEVAFYLVIPFLYVLARRWGWRILAVIFVGSAMYSAALHHLGEDRLARQLPGQMQFFVAGMALNLYGCRIRLQLWQCILIVVGFFTTWTLVHPIPDGIRPLIVAPFVYCVAFALPPAQLRNDLSYSVYLIHGPLIQVLILLRRSPDTLFGAACIVICVIAMAFVTERVIERPCIALGHRLSRRTGQSASALPKLA